MYYCEQTFRFFSSHCTLQGRTITNKQNNLNTITLREPLGVVGLITPWNYPLL